MVLIIILIVYLWFVDELVLGCGIWVIEFGMKLGWCLFGVFDIEEVIFFFVINIFIVFGMVVFD